MHYQYSLESILTSRLNIQQKNAESLLLNGIDHRRSGSRDCLQQFIAQAGLEVNRIHGVFETRKPRFGSSRRDLEWGVAVAQHRVAVGLVIQRWPAQKARQKGFLFVHCFGQVIREQLRYARLCFDQGVKRLHDGPQLGGTNAVVQRVLGGQKLGEVHN
jgi:hypothetical protein